PACADDGVQQPRRFVGGGVRTMDVRTLLSGIAVSSPPQLRRGGAKRRGGVVQTNDFLDQHHPSLGLAASAFPSSAEEGSYQPTAGHSNGKRFSRSIFVGIVMFIAAATQSVAQVKPIAPVTQAMLLNPSPDDWLMYSRTYDAQRYSPLDQINKQNAG